MKGHNSLDTINILQWNAKSLKKRIPELSYHSQTYDVILISETWLSEPDTICIKGFDIIREDRLASKGGGVAIFVHHGIKYKIKDILYCCGEKLEACSVDLYTNRGLLSIVSCYRPPQSYIKSEEWERFLDQFTNNSSFIGGDFNAHNTSWGDPTNDYNGLQLESALLNLDLMVLNQGSSTYINPALNKESVLDLSLISLNLGLISRWQVLQDSGAAIIFLFILPSISRLNIFPSLKK